MEEHSPRNILKTLLIVIAAFVVMILYVFISSAAGSKHSKGVTADMYGTDSLEYVDEPVMKIYVWQKNDKNPDDYPIQVEKYGVSYNLFYDLVPLTLRPGETLSTSQNLFDDDYVNSYVAVTVEYDGPLSGEHEIPLYSMLYYTEDKTRIPIRPFGAGGDKAIDFCNKDGTFSSNEMATLQFIGGYNNFNKPYEDMCISLKSKIGDSGYDILKHLTTEKLTDVYSEALDSLSGIYRYKFSYQVTINAIHPTKLDVIVATVVLEINEYSTWKWEDSNSLELFRKSGYPSQQYSEITVVSYEQSDMFAFE